MLDQYLIWQVRIVLQFQTIGIIIKISICKAYQINIKYKNLSGFCRNTK